MTRLSLLNPSTALCTSTLRADTLVKEARQRCYTTNAPDDWERYNMLRGLVENVATAMR